MFSFIVQEVLAESQQLMKQALEEVTGYPFTDVPITKITFHSRF